MTTDITLAHGLADAGLPLIALPAESPSPVPPPDSRALLAGLLNSDDALFQACVVPLLLSGGAGPEDVALAVGDLDPPRRSALQHLYTAAVCLQREWRTRLRLAGRGTTGFPDLYSRPLGLPDPSTDYGRSCLAAICERMASENAGVRIRGTDRLLRRLIDLMFSVLSREETGAATR